MIQFLKLRELKKRSKINEIEKDLLLNFLKDIYLNSKLCFDHNIHCYATKMNTNKY